MSTQFSTKGYCITPSVFSDAQISSLRQSCHKLIESGSHLMGPEQSILLLHLDINSDLTQSLLKCPNLQKSLRECLSSLGFSSNVSIVVDGAYVEASPDAVTLFSCRLLGKRTVQNNPVMEENSIPWHQDSPANMITAWIPLESLHSEAQGILKVKPIDLDSTPVFKKTHAVNGMGETIDLQSFYGKEEGLGFYKDAVDIVLQEGDVLFIHAKTPHMSMPNLTHGSWRPVLMMRFALPGAEWLLDDADDDNYGSIAGIEVIPKSNPSGDLTFQLSSPLFRTKCRWKKRKGKNCVRPPRPGAPPTQFTAPQPIIQAAAPTESKKTEQEIREMARRELNLDVVKDYNIAFIGPTGVGKSSLINAIRCVENLSFAEAQALSNEAKRNPDPFGPALSGIVETTERRHCYKYRDPEHEHFLLWDLPGGGTRNHPAGTYWEDNRLYAYDFLVIVTAGNFTELDGRLFELASRWGIPAALVRTKMDNSFRDARVNLNDSTQKQLVISRIKDNIIGELIRDGLHVAPERIFLVSYSGFAALAELDPESKQERKYEVDEDVVVDEEEFLRYVMNQVSRRRRVFTSQYCVDFTDMITPCNLLLLDHRRVNSNELVVFNPSMTWHNEDAGTVLIAARAMVPNPSGDGIKWGSWNGSNVVLVARCELDLTRVNRPGLELLDLTCVNLNGAEDPRVMEMGHKIQILATEHLQMKQADIKPPSFCVSSLRTLCSAINDVKMQDTEKNWSPCRLKNQDFVILRHAGGNGQTDFKAVTADGNTVVSSASDANVESINQALRRARCDALIRGGSPGVEIMYEGEPMALFVVHTFSTSDRGSNPATIPSVLSARTRHSDAVWFSAASRSYAEYSRKYYMGFALYRLNSQDEKTPFSLHRCSKFFQPSNRAIEHSRIIFPTGLLVAAGRNNNDVLVVSYGEADTNCRLIGFKFDDVVKKLLPCSEFQSERIVDINLFGPWEPNVAEKIERKSGPPSYWDSLIVSLPSADAFPLNEKDKLFWLDGMLQSTMLTAIEGNERIVRSWVPCGGRPLQFLCMYDVKLGEGLTRSSQQTVVLKKNSYLRSQLRAPFPAESNKVPERNNRTFFIYFKASNLNSSPVLFSAGADKFVSVSASNIVVQNGPNRIVANTTIGAGWHLLVIIGQTQQTSVIFDNNLILSANQGSFNWQMQTLDIGGGIGLPALNGEVAEFGLLSMIITHPTESGQLFSYLTKKWTALQ